MDELLNVIATQRPLPVPTPPQAALVLEDLILLQDQLLFSFRVVLENNLPLSPDVRQQLFQMHDNTSGMVRNVLSKMK
jgi:hypothetical protein